MNKIVRNNSINLKKISNPYIPFGVKLASVPKTPYAPFKKGEPKGHGTEMINTGYEWTMINQASTTRGNTLTYTYNGQTYTSWRASDSYPLAVWYGEVIYNATGSAWTIGSHDYFTPNAPAQQVEIACKNIEADIIAGMYTDLVITNYTPSHPNVSTYPTSIFIRYIRAIMLNTKIIIKAVKKLSQLLAINEYMSNVSSLFVNRSNILITNVSRRSFIASMELLNAALKQIPIHKDIWKSYSGLWNVSFDPEKANSAYTYVTPSIFEFDGETYDSVSKFCSIAETSGTSNPGLIISSSINDTIDALMTPGQFIGHFLTDTESNFRNLMATTADAYADIFKTLSQTVAAMSQAFQPFIVAMIRVGDKYFSDIIERNPNITDLMQSKFTEFKDFETMGFIQSYTPTVTDQNQGRTVSMTVPLFNSFTPIEMFKKNGILMCKGMDNSDPSQSYKAIIDVSKVWPHTIHMWNSTTEDSTHGAFSKVTESCLDFPGVHKVISNIPSTLTFEMNFKIDPHNITDLGVFQYLQNNVVAFIANAETGTKQTYYYHKDLCGFRTVMYEPILDKLMERAPYVFGVNSQLVKAIKS